MASKQTELSLETSPAPPKRSLWPTIALLFCLIVSMPVLFEVTLVCYGHWMETFDHPVDIRTPMLNKIGDAAQTARHEVWNSVSSYLDHAAVDPRSLLLVGVVALTVAGLLLRL